MWCFACYCFPQQPSSVHQDPWFFQPLRYSHFSKFSTLSRYRIRGVNRSEISRHLLVWAYHEWCVRLYVRRECKALFFPEISSQNTAAFCVRSVSGEKWLWGCRDSHSQFPGSLLWTPRAFGAQTIHLATKYDEERLAVFRLELSYGSSSNYLIFIRTQETMSCSQSPFEIQGALRLLFRVSWNRLLKCNQHQAVCHELFYAQNWFLCFLTF